VRRSRFCASLLEWRQCERAELDRSVVSLDHDRTRLGLVRSLAIDVSPSTSLRSMRVFPFSTIVTSRPISRMPVGLPLARTIGNIRGTIGNIKGRSLAAVDGSGLIGPNPRPLRQRPVARPPNRTPLIMAQRRRTSTVNARRQRATTRDTTRARHTRVRAVISRWHHVARSIVAAVSSRSFF
jgi:hypothetical protein